MAMMDTIRERTFEVASKEAEIEQLIKEHSENVSYLGKQIGALQEEIHNVGRQLAGKIRQHRKDLARADEAEAVLATKEAEHADLVARHQAQQDELELVSHARRASSRMHASHPIARAPMTRAPMTPAPVWMRLTVRKALSHS